MVLTSCTFEVKLKGIVVDEINHLPISNAQVKTLKGANEGKMDFIEVHTDKAGKFEIIYNSNQVKAEKLWVEVSKENYLSNMYPVSQNSFDTIILNRSTINNSNFSKWPDN